MFISQRTKTAYSVLNLIAVSEIVRVFSSNQHKTLVWFHCGYRQMQWNLVVENAEINFHLWLDKATGELVKKQCYSKKDVVLILSKCLFEKLSN